LFPFFIVYIKKKENTSQKGATFAANIEFFFHKKQELNQVLKNILEDFVS